MEDVSFHYFPGKKADHQRYEQWVHRVQRCRPNFTPLKCCSLCSVHFEGDCCTMQQDLAKECGVRVKLWDDSVPTINAAK